jgi:hypothetical protein
MTENCSYNSKAQKNKDAGVLMYSFACKYYFLIARRFEWGKQANPVESFLLSAAVHVILNGVVVTALNTSAGSPSSNPWVVTYFLSACFNY